MRQRTEHRSVATKGRSLSLRASLVGFVIATLCINAGFWAALMGADPLAEALHGAVLASGIFVVSMFLASVVFPSLKVVWPRA